MDAMRSRKYGEQVPAVAAKHEDFESMMTSFSSLLEESFQKAEARARDIGAFLSESSEATTAP